MRKFTKYPSSYVSATKSKKKSKDREIYEFLDMIGGYNDYNGKIEDIMDEFGLTKEDAEGYVWNHASGLDRLNGLR